MKSNLNQNTRLMKKGSTTYTEEIADKICGLISTTNLGLQAICSEEGMPGRATVYEWLQANPSFQRKYTLAKELQADLLVEEILAISDDKSEDTIKVPRYKTMVAVPNNANINRAKLMVASRKWMISKLAPKKYSDTAASASGHLPPAPLSRFHEIHLID